jgi:ribose 5-phosphate isomerase A
MTIAERALEMIADGAAVGLGSGRAATEFVHALGRRVQAGLRIRGVPTSEATAELARRLGIPLGSLEEIESLDIAVDGADEVDPQLNLIKGLGGALVREKVVAAAARRLVILVGAEKLVPVLGSHGVLPVEVVPFALPFCRRRLEALGYPAQERRKGGKLFLSDNGNPILDCRVGPLADPAALDAAIRAIPGVVGTGLFLGMAHTVLIQEGETIQLRQASNP